VVRLGGAEPRRAATVCGSHIEIVAESDSPDRDCPSQPAVTSNWRDLDFFGCSEPVELVASPLVDSRASFDHPAPDPAP
jgi:hypothetical protein